MGNRELIIFKVGIASWKLPFLQRKLITLEWITRLTGCRGVSQTVSQDFFYYIYTYDNLS